MFLRKFSFMKNSREAMVVVFYVSNEETLDKLIVHDESY